MGIDDPSISTADSSDTVGQRFRNLNNAKLTDPIRSLGQARDIAEDDPVFLQPEVPEVTDEVRMSVLKYLVGKLTFCAQEREQRWILAEKRIDEVQKLLENMNSAAAETPKEGEDIQRYKCIEAEVDRNHNNNSFMQSSLQYPGRRPPVEYLAVNSYDTPSPSEGGQEVELPEEHPRLRKPKNSVAQTLPPYLRKPIQTHPETSEVSNSLPPEKRAILSPVVRSPELPQMGQVTASHGINGSLAAFAHQSTTLQEPEKIQYLQPPPPPQKTLRNITDLYKITKAAVTPPAPHRIPHAAVEEVERTSPTPRRRPGPLSSRFCSADTSILRAASVEEEKEYSDDGRVKAPPPVERPQAVKAARAASGVGVVGCPGEFAPSGPQHSMQKGLAQRRLMLQRPMQQPTQTSPWSSFPTQATKADQPAQRTQPAESRKPVVRTAPVQPTARTESGEPGESEEPHEPGQQMQPKIGAGSFRSQEQVHVVPSVGVKVTTAVYPLPDGHSQPWNRTVHRPVQIETPPTAFYMRTMVPVSFKDSGLNPRDRAGAFNRRLQEMERCMGLSGRYCAERHYNRRGKGKGSAFSSARGCVRGSAYGGSVLHSSHDHPPLVIDGEPPTIANRVPKNSMRPRDRTPGPYSLPVFPEPIEQKIRLRCTIILESVPENVSVADISRALVDTGRIHSIQTGANDQGRFVAIRFAYEEAAQRLAQRKLLAVSSVTDEDLGCLPIGLVKETLVRESLVDPMGENFTRILTIGPCPMEYFVAGYLEHAGPATQEKDAPLDYIWEILEERCETPIEASLRTRGVMAKARLNFRSIHAAADALREFKNLQAFERVRIDFARDP